MYAGTALITSGDSQAGLASAKFLAGAGYRVVTLTSQTPPMGARSRYSSANHVVPETDAGQFEARLLDVIERIRPDVFVPLGSAAAFVASRHRERLMAIAGVNVPSMDAFMAAYDKDRCLAECRDLGIPCPVEYSLEEAMALFERDPETILVVKPARDIGSAKGVAYVRNREELTVALSECNSEFDTALIQEYIPGGSEAIRSVAVMFSPESELMAAFTMRKLREWPESGGRMAVAVTTADDRLVRQVLPFFERWRWCGPAEAEFKTDPRTGEDKLIEINPRVPGYLRILCDSGLGFQALASGGAQHANLQPVPFPSYRVGVMYYDPFLVLRRLWSGLGNGGVTNAPFRAAMSDMRNALPAAGSVLSDPIPWFGKAFAGFRATPAAPLSWS